MSQIKIIDDGTLSDNDKKGAIGDIQFVIDKEKININAGFYKVINMIVPISIILLLSLIWNILRKKKYIHKNKGQLKY